MLLLMQVATSLCSFGQSLHSHVRLSWEVGLKQGQPIMAVESYRQMCEVAAKPNNYLFESSTCANAADSAAGKEVHADLLASGDEVDVFVDRCLIGFADHGFGLEAIRRHAARGHQS